MRSQERGSGRGPPNCAAPFPACTFDSEVEDVVAVLDAMLHITAVDPRVVGAQLGEQQRGVSVTLMEDGQGGTEAVVLTHLHPFPSCYQDLRLPAFRDEGPFDPGGSQHCSAPCRAGSGQGCEVGDEAGDGDVPCQHSVKGWVPWDGHLQGLEVI